MNDSDAQWDERYAASTQVWSGHPNGALVADVADLPPGRAVDVGCGEGADAVWLARRGWAVTAVEVSAVALERGRRAAEQAGVPVTWLLAGLLDAGLPAGGFELVSAQYPALLRTPGGDAERALVEAVAPGGHLLVVHHLLDEAALAHAAAHGLRPELFVSPRDVLDRLPADWDVAFDENRARHVEGGGGSHHTVDVVLHACRPA